MPGKWTDAQLGDYTVADAELGVTKGAWRHARLYWERRGWTPGVPVGAAGEVEDGVLATAGDTLDVKPSADEADYDTFFAHIEASMDMIAETDPSQELTTFRYGEMLPVGVMFTGDWHSGHSGVLMSQLTRDLETLRDEPGLFGVGMGDYVENINAKGKISHAIYESAFPSPDMQARYALMRADIARGKWLALTDGNHDAWTYMHAGIDRTAAMARYLDAPYFSEAGGTIFLGVGNCEYRIAVKHNHARGGSSVGAKQMHLARTWPYTPDVVCLAHLHFNECIQFTHHHAPRAYLRSGTYKVRDRHAEAGGFVPEYGVPVCVFYPDSRRMVAFNGNQFDLALAFLRAERLRYVSR